MEPRPRPRPSRMVPDPPPLESERNGACVNVYGKWREAHGQWGWGGGWTGTLYKKVVWLTPHFSSPHPQCSPLPWSVPSLAQACAALAWPAET